MEGEWPLLDESVKDAAVDLVVELGRVDDDRGHSLGCGLPRPFGTEMLAWRTVTTETAHTHRLGDGVARGRAQEPGKQHQHNDGSKGDPSGVVYQHVARLPDGRDPSSSRGARQTRAGEVPDVVEDGTVVVIIEAMKMENELRALRRATVVSVLVREGDNVQGGQPLLVLE